MGILKTGQIVQTALSQTRCIVGALLGGGTQGEVYRATLGPHEYALKWYRPEYVRFDDRLRERLEVAISSGPPNERFLWPFDLASTSQSAGFGYLMPLLASQFKSLPDLMRGEADPDFRALVTVGFNLAHSFLLIHAKGFCYRDISFGNVFFDPVSGEVRIADNDNVDINGRPGPVLGTPKFMAPELVRGEAAPSIETDLYSLSVLLFYIFMMHHPLDGKREVSIPPDPAGRRKLYGTEPVFVFDPTDRSNEPVPGYHDMVIAHWPIYPQLLRDLFTQAFTAGLCDPANGRVREGQWRQAMCHLRDAIFNCSQCLAENFYDVAYVQASGGRTGNCWSCKQALQVPARLRIRKNVVMLNRDTELFPHHFDSHRMYDFSRPVAMVTANPLSLKNLSEEKWVSRRLDEPLEEVPPGSSLRLSSAMKIYFGRTEGEIRL